MQLQMVLLQESVFGERELIGTNWRRLREHREEIDRKKSVFLQFLFFCFLFERKLIFFSSLCYCCYCCCHCLRKKTTEQLLFIFLVQDGLKKVTVSLFSFLSLSITLSGKKLSFSSSLGSAFIFPSIFFDHVSQLNDELPLLVLLT